jgi:hypothetical protein
VSQVYFLRPIGMVGPVKIGSSRVPHERMMTCSNWSPFPLGLVAAVTGGVDLEQRFHALLRDHHSHGEWFFPTKEVMAVVEAVIAGTFDLSSLPEPYRLSGRNRRSRESVEAGSYYRKLTAMGKRGVKVPPEVVAASFSYGVDPDERTRRRAIVKAFVLSAAPP